MARSQKQTQEPMPKIDEDWWAAVLAEEGRHAEPQPEHARMGARGSGHGAADGSAVAVDWPRVQEIYRADQIVSLRVTGHNRGGLLVGGDGISGFVPHSHLVRVSAGPGQAEHAEALESYLGAELRLKVIECTPEEGRIVFSERAALAEPGRRTALFGQMHPGQIVEGTITNITDFGVFVDLGGVEGLIHISELSWGRVLHPNQIVQVGQRVKVQVLDLSPERCRVALSLKRLLPNPWRRSDSEFPVGRVLAATVTSVLSYGAFARLEAGVEGLVHVSEMPLAAGQAVRDLLEPGQSITVRVLHIDSVRQRMGLSMLLEKGPAISAQS